MPTYEYLCDSCRYRTEVVASFESVEKLVVHCPTCLDTAGKPMLMRRLITGGSGIIFKGSWPTQDFKRRGEDEAIQRRRRKACVLKKTGQVPQEAVIGLNEADKLYDSRNAEGNLDELYKGEVKEEK